MASEKLTALAIKRLSKPGFYGDGAGLYLQIEGASRSWVYRYKFAGRERRMGLGSERNVTLAEARDAAREARRLARQGADPLEQRRAAKALVAAMPAVKSFEAVADEYIATKKSEWKNAKHGKQWRATLELYVFPFIGENAINCVSVDDVLRCLRPIWETKPETASRVRGRIESVLDAAKTKGWRTGDNPARLRGHLAKVLPNQAKFRKVKHHAALGWADLPAVMTKLGASSGMSAPCLRFAILTAARSGEARGARWSEIDLAARTWSIPAERMKARKPHRVPLSDAAICVLEAVQPLKEADCDLVFPGGKIGKPLSDVAVSQALKAVAAKITVHGFRSTFRDWCAEATQYPRGVAEIALAHINKDKVEAAYLRSDLFDQRALLMRDWGEFCTTAAGTSGDGV